MAAPHPRTDRRTSAVFPQTFAAESDRARLSPAALRAMKRIADRWHLKGQEAAALLGLSASTWDRIAAGKWDQSLSQDQLTRVSAVVGVFKALHLLFADDMADRWAWLRNKGAPFENRTPIEAMIEGGIPLMLDVRRHVDALRGELEALDIAANVQRIAQDRTIRLVATARLRDPVLLELVAQEDSDRARGNRGRHQRPAPRSGGRSGPARSSRTHIRNYPCAFHQRRVFILAAALIEPLQRPGPRRLVCRARARDLCRRGGVPHGTRTRQCVGLQRRGRLCGNVRELHRRLRRSARRRSATRVPRSGSCQKLCGRKRLCRCRARRRTLRNCLSVGAPSRRHLPRGPCAARGSSGHAGACHPLDLDRDAGSTGFGARRNAGDLAALARRR